MDINNITPKKWKSILKSIVMALIILLLCLLYIYLSLEVCKFNHPYIKKTVLVR